MVDWIGLDGTGGSQGGVKSREPTVLIFLETLRIAHNILPGKNKAPHPSEAEREWQRRGWSTILLTSAWAGLPYF